MHTQTRIIVLCSAALCVPLLVPLFLGRMFSDNDLITYHIPIRYLFAKALQAGDSVLWSSAMYSGIYALGEWQAGMMHPFHVVLFKYLPLSAAVNIEIAIGYVAALAGARVLLRRLGLSRESAWFGAMVFAFCGFNLLRFIHLNVIEIIGHLPWILLAIHVLFTSESGRARAWAFAGTALLLGSQLLLGYPQYVWFTLLAAGYLSLCLLIAGAPWRRLGLVAGALAGGVLIGALQVLPTLDLLSTSQRSDPSLDFRLTFSLNPLNLVQLFSPYAFERRIYAHPFTFQVHESSVYNGAFCTIALVWLALRYRQLKRRRLAIALVVMAGISLLFALGRYGGVYFLIAQLPGVSSFRAPGRHVLLFHLALSGIAALVFEDMVDMVRARAKLPRRTLWLLAAPAALSVAITAVAAILTDSSWARGLNLQFSELSRAAPWSGLVLLTTALVVLAGSAVRASIPLLVVVVALDLGLWGYLFMYDTPLKTIDEIAATAQVPHQAQAGELYQPLKGGNLENLGVVRDLRVSTAYVALVPAAVLDPDSHVAQRLSGVTWRLQGSGWIELTERMPRVRLLSHAERSDDIAREIERIDISQTALTTSTLGELSGPAGEAAIVVDRPGRIVVKTVASGRQLLVLTERFRRGWRATEDGRRDCEALPVYGDFLGCVVHSGTHEITFEFVPDSYRIGRALAFGGLAFAVLGAVIIRRRRS